MESSRISLFVFATMMVNSLVSSRAVNISNTWMLPEEGFPVFYRYFRDRISWYEADAVCQFHHANLVTAESTSQYDAIRAYLKELDIIENIWIGLSKTTERPGFTWTNFHPLNGDGHWQQPIPKGNDAICVSMDPVADFLWKPMPCGGPEIASFICELPVPSWAIGPKGCLLTELPSLTVLYIPEQLALELTSDCGLDGTKRITCKGNADREEILRQLTCAMSPDDFEDKSTKLPILSNTASSTASDLSSDYVFSSSKTTKPWIWTSNTVDTDYGVPTRHRRETEDTLSPSSTKSTTDLSIFESHMRNKLTTTTSSGSANETETTSFSPEDVMLDSIASLSPEKSEEQKATQSVDATTQTEEQAEMSGSSFASTESKLIDSELQDNGEYPSAIGQGQLFSIIENGTMFDIIEVNETSDLEQSKDIMMETPQSQLEILGASTDRANENLYTTVVYHKEPPSEINFVTNKSVKKNEKQFKKHLFKHKEPKKLNQQVTDKTVLPKNNVNKFEYDNANKMLSKEMEMYPVMTDPLVKLNRTHRKEVPFSDERITVEETSSLDDSFTTEINSDKHQHVEIKWQDERNKNPMQMKLFITTKRIDVNKEPVPTSKQIMESLNNTINDQPTVKIVEVGSNGLVNSNVSEVFATLQPEEIKATSEESSIIKEEFQPKSLIGETQTDTSSELPSLNESLQPEPQLLPRPNRQRQLTRPQRRSFYPYFFSRVLG